MINTLPTSAPLVEFHLTGLSDPQGRAIMYRTEITWTGRAWRVTGQQLRDGVPFRKPCSPRHVYSLEAAQTMAEALFRRHKRYIERTLAIHEVKAAAAAEDLAELEA